MTDTLKAQAMKVLPPFAVHALKKMCERDGKDFEKSYCD